MPSFRKLRGSEDLLSPLNLNSDVGRKKKGKALTIFRRNPEGKEDDEMF